jgi:hypothetical protein
MNDPNVNASARSVNRTWSRRSFLTYTGLAVGATAVPLAGRQLIADRADAAPGARWSDPATWGGTLPGPTSVATVSGVVTLDRSVNVGGIVIAPGAQLIFDPAASITLTTTGNIHNQGTLTMRPSSAAVVHQIVFSGVNEAAFVGGGMSVLGTDVGLWTMGDGVLDIGGTPKRAWTRSSRAVTAGATTLILAEAPTGWVVGDEVALTPTVPPTASRHYDAYDVAKITAISGNQITLSKPCAFDHPVVMIGDGRGFACEVLNLTRNVRIGGASTGRAHVFIMSRRPQNVAHAELRWVAPNKKLGRYGLHFHMCADGSNGSLVDSVVVRDAEDHAFVPHTSHGITFRNCISHDTYGEAYWWDQATSNTDVPNAPRTNRAVYDSCVASRVRSSGTRGVYRNTGFMLGAGEGSKMVNCVAVGVQGIVQASGILWGEFSQGVWTFDNSITHNNQVDGVFTWQNNGLHVVKNLVAYHNGMAGLEHGAYVNRYQYQGAVLYGNGKAGLILHSMSMSASGGPAQRFSDFLIDGAGLSQAAVIVTKHSLAATTPTVLERFRVRGYRTAGIMWDYVGWGQPSVVDIVDWTFEGNEVFLVTGVHPDVKIRLQDAAHGALQIRPAGQSGTSSTAWNAAVTAIPAFAQSVGSAPIPQTQSPVTTAPTTTTSPSPTTAPSSTTTAPTTTTTRPATTTTTGAPTTTTASTTTTAPASGTVQTFRSANGSADVVVDATGVHYKSATANAGYTVRLMDDGPAQVKVDFMKDGHGNRLWVIYEAGNVTFREYTL